MNPLSRRLFLGTTLAELAAANLLADEKRPTLPPEKKPESPPANIVKPVSNPTIQQVAKDAPDKPSTLFLTWQRDPTTTMTIQWVGPKKRGIDTQIYYMPANAPKFALWKSQPTVVRPYPNGDFSLYRTELTGLAPDTEYTFGIGVQKMAYRFRTMPAKATNPIHFISGGDSGVNEHAVANNISAARQDPIVQEIVSALGAEIVSVSVGAQAR